MSVPAFGDMIRRGREEARLSQARLAELIGKSPSTIRSWEHGRSRPAEAGSVKAVAAVLGINESEMLEASGFEPPPEAKPRATIEQELISLATERTVMIRLPETFAPEAPSPFDGDEEDERAAPVAEPPEVEVTAPSPAATNESRHTSRKVTTLAPTAPVMLQSLSYVEDADQNEFYWRRWALTAVTVLFLVVVLMWAMDQAGAALGDFLSEFFGAFNI
ncbi:MAG: helix-turn-helix transcriptional regulator [Acidimicrobiia bacterium]|nr:helix-turn-helix transcriptional regulator [Acidimicrobiia bacterium]